MCIYRKHIEPYPAHYEGSIKTDYSYHQLHGHHSDSLGGVTAPDPQTLQLQINGKEQSRREWALCARQSARSLHILAQLILMRTLRSGMSLL